MNILDVLKAFHAAAPAEAMAHLDPLNAWTEPLGPHANSGQGWLGEGLLASGVPAFRDRALAQLPPSPWNRDIGRRVLGALASARNPTDFTRLPIEWRASWAADVYAQLKQESSHSSSHLEDVARCLFSAVPPRESTDSLQAWSDLLTEAVVQAAPADASVAVRQKASVLLFKAALACPNASRCVVDGLLRQGEANPKLARAAFAAGHFAAVAAFVESGHATGTSILRSVSDWHGLLTAAVGRARTPQPSVNPDDIFDAEGFVDPSNPVMERLGTPDGRQGLVRLALASFKVVAAVASSDELHGAVHAQALKRQLITRWTVAAEWLGVEWAETLKGEGVSTHELTELLFCRSDRYVVARLSAGVEDRAPRQDSEMTQALRAALKQACRVGWNPERGFQPAALAVLQERGWISALPARLPGKKNRSSPGESQESTPEEEAIERSWTALVLSSTLPAAPTVRRARL